MPGWLKKQAFISHGSGCCKIKIKCGQSWLQMRPLSLAFRSCLLAVPSHSLFSVDSLLCWIRSHPYQVLKGPFKFNYLLKSLSPNTVPLEFRPSVYEFGGNTSSQSKVQNSYFIPQCSYSYLLFRALKYLFYFFYPGFIVVFDGRAKVECAC